MPVYDILTAAHSTNGPSEMRAKVNDAVTEVMTVPKFLRELSERKSRRVSEYRAVAQLVARLVWDQQVAGSSPVGPTKNTWILSGCFL